MAVWTAEEKQNFRNAHPCAMPEKQTNHNYPHADVKGYFDAIFASDHPEYKGMVPIATKCGGSVCIVASVPAERIGEWAEMMHVSVRQDYYYGKAQTSNAGTWDSENSFAYNAIYVDIDAHTSSLTIPDFTLINALCYALPDKGIPSPNMLESSGRGYHLVWTIEQVSAALGWMVRSVSAHFAALVQESLDELHAQGYSVDMGYSSNICGLTRIPGTYNVAAKAYSSFQKIHGIRMDLPKIYDTISARTQNRKFAHATFSGTEVIGQRRVDALLRLSSIRSIQEGYRDVFSLHLFSAAQMAGMTTQNAIDLCKEINSSFDDPLPNRKIEQYLSTAAKKQYKFRTQRIIDDLGITAAELSSIGLKQNPNRDSNRARNARNAEKKRNRDRAIMRLHLSGFSPSSIAEKVGHAYNTIRKVIETYKDSLSQLFTYKELRYIFRQRIRKVFSALKADFQNMKRNILCSYLTALGIQCTSMSIYASTDSFSRNADVRAGPPEQNFISPPSTKVHFFG